MHKGAPGAGQPGLRDAQEAPVPPRLRGRKRGDDCENMHLNFSCSFPAIALWYAACKIMLTAMQFEGWLLPTDIVMNR